MSAEKDEKETYVRRRAFNKIHVTSWLIYLEKDGFVRCPFQNCNFMAFDVNEMCDHYGFCKGDSSFAKYVCEVCNGCTVSEKRLHEHRSRAHNISISPEEASTLSEADQSDPGKPTRVMLLFWGFFFDKHKYIKCPNCNFLANTMTDMCHHYLVCKQERKFLVYVCPECKGRSSDVAPLIQHLERAHNISKRPDQFNHISRNMVQFWEKELRDDKYATCLHINGDKVRDCLYIDVDLLGINEHSQTCKGPHHTSSAQQWFCTFCGKWTSSEEKLAKHLQLSHGQSCTPAVHIEQNLHANYSQSAVKNVKVEVLSEAPSNIGPIQFSPFKKRLTIQSKEITSSTKKEPPVSPKPSTQVFIKSEYDSKQSQINHNSLVKKSSVIEANQSHILKETKSMNSNSSNVLCLNSSSPKYIRDRDIQNSPERTQESMAMVGSNANKQHEMANNNILVEERPVTKVCNNEQINQEIFLDLVEDKLVARRSIEEVNRNKNIYIDISNEDYGYKDDFTRQLETGLPKNAVENGILVKDEENTTPQIVDLTEDNLMARKNVSINLDKNKFGNTELETIEVNAGTNYKDNSAVRNSTYEGSCTRTAEYKRTNSSLPFDSNESSETNEYKPSLRLYEEEIEIIDVVDGIVPTEKDKAFSMKTEQNVARDDGKGSKTSKYLDDSCYVLFKDEFCSDEEGSTEEQVVVNDKKEEDIKLCFDWGTAKRVYNNKSPKSYTRRKSNHDKPLSFSPPKSVKSLLEPNSHPEKRRRSIDVNQDGPILDVDSCKRDYENLNKTHLEAKNKSIFQNRICSFGDMQEEASKNSEKNDKLMLYGNSSVFLSQEPFKKNHRDKTKPLVKDSDPVFESLNSEPPQLGLICTKSDKNPIKSNFKTKPGSSDSIDCSQSLVSHDRVGSKTLRKASTTMIEDGVSNVIVLEAECKELDEGLLPKFTTNIDKQIKGEVCKSKDCIDLTGDDSQESCQDLKYNNECNVFNSASSQNLNNIKTCENVLRESKLVSFFYHGKLNKSLLGSNTSSMNGEVENVKQSTNVKCLKENIFSNEQGSSRNHVDKLQLMSRRECQNSPRSIESGNDIGVVQEQKCIVDADSCVVRRIQSDFLVECSSDEDSIGKKISGRSCPDPIVLETASNDKLSEKSVPEVERKLDDRRVSSDFFEESSFDEEDFLRTDEEIGMKDQYFSGFKEISENIQSKNKRFHQFLTRLSESENEEWYVNAGNLSMDIRKDIRLSQEKSVSIKIDNEFDELKNISEKITVIVEGSDEEDTGLKSLENCNDGVKGINILSVLNLKSKVKSSDMLPHGEIHNTYLHLKGNREKVEKSMISGVQNTQKSNDKGSLTIDSCKGDSNPVSTQDIKPLESLKVSLSIHKINLSSKPGLESKFLPLAEKDGVKNKVVVSKSNVNNLSSTNTQKLERKNTGETKTSVEEFSGSKECHSNEEKLVAKKSFIELNTTNECDLMAPNELSCIAIQSNVHDKIAISNDCNEEIKAPVLLCVRNVASNNESKVKNRNKNISMSEILLEGDKTESCKIVDDEIGEKDQTVNKPVDEPEVTSSSTSTQLIAKSEFSDEQLTTGNGQFQEQTEYFTPVGPKTVLQSLENTPVTTHTTCNASPQWENGKNHNSDFDDVTLSDDEPLSVVQKTCQLNGKAVLGTKGKLLTEGFSPHDQIQGDNLEPEKTVEKKLVHSDTVTVITEPRQSNKIISSKNVEKTKVKGSKQIENNRGRKSVRKEVKSEFKESSKICVSDSTVETVSKTEGVEEQSTAASNHCNEPCSSTKTEILKTTTLDTNNLVKIDNTIVTESPSIKKRRGRPPKMKVNEMSADFSLNSRVDPSPENIYDNELLISIYSEQVKTILRDGLLEDSKTMLNENQSSEGKHQVITKCSRESFNKPHNSQNSSLTDIQNENNVPKKRGRKPKLKLDSNSSEQTNFTGNSRTSEKIPLEKEINDIELLRDSSSRKPSDILTTVPKKRGRPSKSLKLPHDDFNYSEMTADNLSDEFNKDKIKKQSYKDSISLDGERGSSDNKLLQSEHSVPSNLSNVDDSQIKHTETDEVSLPKKRGRKPKSQIKFDFTDHQQSLNLECRTSPLPEKRSRRSNRFSEIDNAKVITCDKSENTTTTRKRKSVRLTSDINDTASEVSSASAFSVADGSVTSELLGTDVIYINEERLGSSINSSKRTRKCKVRKLETFENNSHSDGSENDNLFSSDDSDKDVSYKRPRLQKKRRKIDTDSDGEIDKTTEKKSKKRINSSSPASSYAKTKHRNNDKVVCGACKEEMLYSTYKNSHAVFKHYMLTWIEGEESPVDMRDQKDIENRLWSCKKRLGKTPFRCPVCNLPKLSAVGFYSHILFCGKDDKEKESLLVTCELCGAKLMPSSIKPHLYMKHQNKSSESVTKADQVDVGLIVKGRRAAATRAVEVIQKSQADDQELDGPGSRANSPLLDRKAHVAHLYIKPSKLVPPAEYQRWKDSLSTTQIVSCTFPGCDASANSTVGFRKHYLSCPFGPPRVYKCRLCSFTSPTEEPMVDHVEEKHEMQGPLMNSDDDSSSDSDGGDHRKSYPLAYQSYGSLPFKFLKALLPKKFSSRKSYFTGALMWTLQLRESMFAKDSLYPDALPRIEDRHPLTPETAGLYLPQLACSIKFRGSDDTWQTLQRFQGCLVDGVPMLFVGGPVWSTAWAPVPYPEEHQYLAVAPHTNIETTHEMSSIYNYPGLIQIWALGSLNNINGAGQSPQLVLGLGHRRGPVWGLAWCPAGAYSPDRLGLLAAACGDGSIVIHSVPRVTQAPDDPASACLSTQPVFELKLGCEMLAQCTCVEWHAGAPHSIIAGGFANGMVALWDLNTTSPLLRNGITLLPFKVIEAHHSSVTAVKLSCTKENPYMMTASLDRSTKFWKLDDTEAPVNSLRKAGVTDAVMTNNWLLSISAYDDVYSINNSHVTGCSYRDFFSNTPNLILQPGTVWGLSFNDWLNGCACASEMGRVMAFFRQQLLVTEESKKVNRTAFTEEMVSCSARSIQDDSLLTCGFGPLYSDCAATVGLEFKFKGDTKGPKTACSSDNMDSYPIRSFNTVSWNPNLSSFTWLAAGMQCGLVAIPRVTNVNKDDLAQLYQHKDGL